MYDINVWTLIAIITITVIIIRIFTIGSEQDEHILYLCLGMGVFMYSGFGISYSAVSNSYIIPYSIFLLCLFAPIKLIMGRGYIRITFGKRSDDGYLKKLDDTLDRYPNFYAIMASIFLLSIFVYLLTPTVRISNLWNPPISSAIGIHARRNTGKNLIITLANTLNIASMPFFFVYLQKLIERKKIVKYFLMIAIWMYLDFLKYGYLSRYEMMVYLMFAILSIGIMRYGEIKLDRGMRILLIAVGFLVVPFLASYIYTRTGASYQSSSFVESVMDLIYGETYYPIYYDKIIQTGQGLISPIVFVLWLICLPIPSVVWPTKPTIDPSYEFTKMLIGNVSKTSATYYNSLPSVLGESFLIFGDTFYFVEALLIGIFVGIYFRFFFKSKKLSVLSLYMIIMLVTVGRGGATSYMSAMINGSIILIIWTWLSPKLSIGGK